MDSRDILIELRRETGMKRTEFADYFEIPYRTVQEWELGNRKMPKYLLHLMRYKLEMEKLIREKEEERGGDAYDK
ncbi:transcriptional regulator [Roseburia hominis]